MKHYFYSRPVHNFHNFYENHNFYIPACSYPLSVKYAMKNKNTTKKPLEEGMFYEKAFAPIFAKLKTEKMTFYNLKGEPVEKNIRVLTLSDINEEEMTVVGNKLITRVCYYLRKKTEFKGLHTCKPMTDLEDKELEEVLQSALDDAEEDGDPINLKFLLDHQDELVSIVSTKHEQISWAKLREVIERPIKDEFGELRVEEFGTGRYSYRVPIDNKDGDVSAWVGLDVGNNKKMGRSGIRIFTRFRTEKGRGGVPACLNWANLWQEPLAFFNVPVVRLHESIDKALVKSLNMQEVHLTNTAQGLEELEQQVRETLPQMKKAIEEYIPKFITASKEVALTVKEMDAILEAYSVKVQLPQYIRAQIIEIAKWQKQFNVWGFSNAVSWVRTHGEIRKSKNDHENHSVVRNLESVAGEILSLTPTIKALKEKVGTITLKTLIKPQKETVVAMEAPIAA